MPSQEIKGSRYAVIFYSRQSIDNADYGAAAERIAERARLSPGFISMESVHDTERNGITVCYWESLEAINNWKQNLDHQNAQQLGKERWFEQYRIIVAKVEYEYSSSE